MYPIARKKEGRDVVVCVEVGQVEDGKRGRSKQIDG
jgi:hypothetical protein